MFTTPNMGLIEWDLGDDPYDHSQLAANFNNLDLHDHSSGKGARLGTNSLLDGSITTAKLADNSVTGAKIVNNTITQNKLDPTILRGMTPLGEVISWWRVNTSVAIPTGWSVCDGSAWSSISNDMGLTTGNIPDLRNNFILGADVSGTGAGTSTPPSIGSQGGSHTASLAHTHTVNLHTHTIQPHFHTVDAHSHIVSGHTHDMNHQHYFANSIAMSGQGNLLVMNPESGFYTNIPAGRFNDIWQTFTDSGYSIFNIGAPNDTNAFFKGYVTVTTPARARNDVWSGPDMSQTGSSSPGTSASAPNTNTVGLTTDASGATTGSSLGSTDIRPKFTGLLYIMKVKY